MTLISNLLSQLRQNLPQEELEDSPSSVLVEMNLRSRDNWGVKKKAQQFAEILLGYDSFLLPEKFDRQEPERQRFTRDNLPALLDIWLSDTAWLHLRRKKPQEAFSIVMSQPPNARQFNQLLASYHQDYFGDGGLQASAAGNSASGVDALLGYLRQLADWTTIDHAHIAHHDDWRRKNEFRGLTQITGGRVAGSGGAYLQDGLPGVYWANVFGPIFVDFFGRERLESAPAYHKEELSNGTFLLLTGASPLDYGQPEVTQREQALIDHLGREAFFEKRHPRKVCTTPDFGVRPFDDGTTADGSGTSEDPIAYIIPNPNTFLEEVEEIAQSLFEHTKTPLDYSPESLDELDNLLFKKSYQRPEPWQSKKWTSLLRAATAYYGEVLLRNLNGRWTTQTDQIGLTHPVVEFTVDGQALVEAPFARLIRFWQERDRSEGASIQYMLYESGQMNKVEQYLANFL